MKQMSPQHLGIEGVLRSGGSGPSCNDQSCGSNYDLTLRGQDASIGRAIPDPHHSVSGVFGDGRVDEVSRYAKRRENIHATHDCTSHSHCNGRDHGTTIVRWSQYLVARLGKSFRAAFTTISESVAFLTLAPSVISTNLVAAKVLNTSAFATFGSGYVSHHRFPHIAMIINTPIAASSTQIAMPMPAKNVSIGSSCEVMS